MTGCECACCNIGIAQTYKLNDIIMLKNENIWLSRNLYSLSFMHCACCTIRTKSQHVHTKPYKQSTIWNGYTMSKVQYEG